MILIIDSGSSKADWIFTDGQNRKSLSTDGLNPYILLEKGISRIINAVEFPYPLNTIEKIYFLGTGCSGPHQKSIVKAAFQKKFKKAKIIVNHDVMGGVIATCGNEKGISCILGTGSNSVYFDGKKIRTNNYGLGYILADEGAGVDLGKRIITAHLYGLLPESLDTVFRKKYKLSRQLVIEKTYTGTAPNAWLASFAGFMIENKNHPWIKETVRESFSRFIELYVMHYPEKYKVPVHFVGSIAFYFDSILRDLLNHKNLKTGKIIRKPIDELEKYYLRENKLLL